MRANGKTNTERLYSAGHWALIPLVAGVLIGMAVSTVLLLQPHTAITNVYLELPAEREDVTSRLNDLMRTLNELGATRRSEVETLAEEVSVKGPVYYAVVMDGRHSAEQLSVLRETWTENISWRRVGYFIPLEEDRHPQVEVVEGATEEDVDEDAHYGEIQHRDTDNVAVVELETRHSDFYMDVLSYVCKAKLNETKWFLFAGDDVYVKSRDLEEHLQHYENIPSFRYLGRPASNRGSANRGCLKGPGTVLSHSALVELCSKIDSCGGSEGEGDRTFGRCITEQLEQGCNGLEKEVNTKNQHKPLLNLLLFYIL